MLSEMSIFEITMLVCFGASWPFSLHKTWKTRNVKGKSAIFLGLIILGYAAGTAHKFLYRPDPVVWLYILNGLMVSADLGLWFRYRERRVKNVAG